MQKTQPARGIQVYAAAVKSVDACKQTHTGQVSEIKSTQINQQAISCTIQGHP